MEDNLIIDTLADSEILENVPGVTEVLLKTFRAGLKNTGVLRPRERLQVKRDIPVLEEIVKIKKGNPSLFYSTLVDIAIRKHYKNKAEALVDKIFENSEGSLIHEAFLDICKEKGIGQDAVDNFFLSANLIADFFNLLGCNELALYFNATIDTLIPAIIGFNFANKNK